MSVVINYVSEFISIIITDTRITFGRNSEGGVEDGYDKLCSLTNMGWCAGAGLHDFLELFKNNLSSLIAYNIEDIEKNYTKSLKEYSDNHPFHNEYVIKSAMSFSWIGIPDNRYNCRLGIMSKYHFENNIAIMENDTINILYPMEYIDNPLSVKEFEKENILKYEYDGNILPILNILFDLFSKIQKSVNSVSRICDIGIQLIIQNDIYKIRIKDDIDNLIDSLKDGSIQNKFNIIDARRINKDISSN